MKDEQLTLAINFLKSKGIVSGQFSYDYFSDEKDNFIVIGNGNVSILIKVTLLNKYEQPKPITLHDKSNLAYMASKNNYSSSGILVLTLNDTEDAVIQGHYEE